MRFDNDRDQADYDHGPYGPEPNCVCPTCRMAFYKAPQDTGDLCDRCAEDAWVSRKEREWKDRQVGRYLHKAVNE